MVTFADSQLQLIAWFLPALLVYNKELQMVRMVDRWKIRQISAGYGGRGSGGAVFEYIM